MRRAPLAYNDVLYVAQRMRDADRREVYATRWSDRPEDLARDTMICGDFSWILGTDVPVAAIGAYAMWPNVWSVWMFATDDFPQIRLSATRFVRHGMIPALVESGAHRAECRSLADHAEAHAWLELLGAKKEGSPHFKFGKNGEDFCTYVWSR